MSSAGSQAHLNKDKEREATEVEEDVGKQEQEEEEEEAAALAQLMGNMAPQQQLLPSSTGSGVYVAGSL